MPTEIQNPADVIEPLWAAGWRWKPLCTVVPFVGFVLAVAWSLGAVSSALGWIGVAAIFGGPVLAVAGLLYVNLNYKEVRDEGLRIAKEEAREIVNLDELEDPETFVLLSEWGGTLPIIPPARYDVALLTSGNNLVTAHDDARVYMVSRKIKIGHDSDELYHDQLTGVAYDAAKKLLTLSTSDGRTLGYESSTEPGDALETIRSRLRSYKRQRVE